MANGTVGLRNVGDSPHCEHAGQLWPAAETQGPAWPATSAKNVVACADKDVDLSRTCEVVPGGWVGRGEPARPHLVIPELWGQRSPVRPMCHAAASRISKSFTPNGWRAASSQSTGNVLAPHMFAGCCADGTLLSREGPEAVTRGAFRDQAPTCAPAAIGCL